ncbi:hypothetical protein KP509_27G006700 [Ceratopteris richardii]|uniref:Cytochrome b5 heme-binding domain-containing protein n=1 Tax=Ceratopteris richardii TaxID=49495 RepID=A0A8T2RF22_CERRI|nr:hypothetical protein KP509_27G006700 [Ceratopteris richardii]
MPPHSHLEASVDEFPSSLPASKPRTYSIPEIRSHNSLESCWLVIKNSIYDVTTWTPYHPGGSLIYVNGRKECAQLFDSYYPSLERTADVEYADFTSLEFESSRKENFYLALKRRVDNYFHKFHINPRMHPHMVIKSFLIILCFIFSYYMTFFGNLVEVISFMWRQQHVVGHQAFSNVNGYDPDIRVLKPNVRRLTREHPKRSHHNFQHIHLPLIHGILALKSVLYDDFASYFTGSIRHLKIAKK